MKTGNNMSEFIGPIEEDLVNTFTAIELLADTQSKRPDLATLHLRHNAATRITNLLEQLNITEFASLNTYLINHNYPGISSKQWKAYEESRVH